MSDKEQLELALDGRYTREASLALDRAVIADDAGRSRRVDAVLVALEMLR